MQCIRKKLTDWHLWKSYENTNMDEVNLNETIYLNKIQKGIRPWKESYKKF